MQALPAVSVFGLGYAGIVQAACLADEGWHVIGVDSDHDRLAAIARGACPFVEPGLHEMLRQAFDDRRLEIGRSAAQAVLASQISVICVDTPTLATGETELRALLACVDAIAAAVPAERESHVVIVRSTVPVGTMRDRVLPRLAQGAEGGGRLRGRCLFIPEFLREGSAIRDYRDPPKTIVGCPDDEPWVRDVVDRLYGKLSAPKHFVSFEAAELAKYADNGWHALKVCFANEVAALSGAFGLDGQRVMELFREDRKLNVSGAYLKPGMPFGGSCLVKDLAALVHMADRKALELPLLASVSTSNERHLDRCVARVLEMAAPRIAVWGLSFKPSTNDLRRSPGLGLVERLLEEGRLLTLHDESIPPDELAGRLASQHPRFANAIAEDRIRIGGAEALEQCAVLVLCHAPRNPVTAHREAQIVRLYQ
jgi:GDP-mannose 6-dehydrogenase